MIIKELVTKITLDPRKALVVFEKFIKKTVSDSNKSAKKVKQSQESAANATADKWSNTGRALVAVNKKFESSSKSTALVVRRSQTQAAVAVARQWEAAGHRMSKATQAASDSAQRASRRATRNYNKGAQADYAAKMGKGSKGVSMGAAAMGLPMRMLGGLTAGYGVYQFGESLMGNVGNEQMLMARLQTVLGSKEAATSKMGMLSKFAETTPYQKNDLAGGFASIAGSGYQMTERDLTALGNVSAGSGKKNFGEMIEMLKSANRGLGTMVDNFDGMRATAKDGMLEMSRYDKQTKKWITKTVKAGDMAGIVGFVREHGETNYTGQMDSMSKTIPGMASTIADKVAQRFVDIGNAGMTNVLNDIMKTLVSLADQSKPFFVAFGKFSADTLPKLVEGFKTIKKYAAPIGGIFAAIATNMFGAKIIGGVKLLLPFFLKSKIFIQGLMLMASSTGGLSAVMTALSMGAGALATALTPLLVGGAIAAGIAAIGYVGYQTYKYFKEGEKGIEGLRNKFPALADLVVVLGDTFRDLQPHLIMIWDSIKYIADIALKALGGSLKWLFEYVAVPLLISFTASLKFIIEQIKLMAEFWIPKLSTAFTWLKDVAIGIKDNFVILFDYLREKFPWLDKIVRAISGGVSSMFGTAEQTGGGAIASSGAASRGLYKGAKGDFFTKNDDLAAKMVSTGRGIISGAKMCLRGVWMTHKAAAGVSKITAQHAYQAADQLAGDSKFREIKVTPQMYKQAMAGDEQMKALLHGTTAIYNTQSGFSKTSGHAEVWDMQNKKALYGMGPSSLNRSDQMIQNARFFVPVSSGGGKGGGPVIQQNITVGPGANTGAVKNAAKQGAAQALTSAGRNNQQRVTPQ